MHANQRRGRTFSWADLADTAIEFGNRLLTFPLATIAGLTFIACLSYRPGGRRRRDLVWLSATLIVLAGVSVQATIGYAQYFSHLPAGLVWLHVATSVALWIFVLRLYLSTREHRPLPAAEDAPVPRAGLMQSGPAARNSQALGVTLWRETVVQEKPAES